MLLPKFSVKAALSRSLARPARISAAGARAVELECSGSNRGAQAVAAEPSIGGQPRPQPASKALPSKAAPTAPAGFWQSTNKGSQPSRTIVAEPHKVLLATLPNETSEQAPLCRFWPAAPSLWAQTRGKGTSKKRLDRNK